MSIHENVPSKNVMADSKQMEENFKQKFNLNFDSILKKT